MTARSLILTMTVVFPAMTAFPGGSAKSVFSPAQALSPGDRVHMSGCFNGRLMALRIDIFEEPPGTISPWVARLRGTSRKRICDGEVVIVKEIRRVRGDLAVLVTPIRQDVQGWVRSQFIGTHFPLYRCHTEFQEEAQLNKCLRGDPAP